MSEKDFGYYNAGEPGEDSTEFVDLKCDECGDTETLLSEATPGFVEAVKKTHSEERHDGREVTFRLSTHRRAA